MLNKDVVFLRNERAWKRWTIKNGDLRLDDYAGEFMPSVRDVMVEASMYLAHLRPLVPPTREEREWFETCPCGKGCEANRGIVNG